MITGHVFIATSLDGFIARKSGELDWLMKQQIGGEEHGYDAFVESVDGLVMGRGSFQNALTFGKWPYDKPVVVMSRTLNQDNVPKSISDRVRLTQLGPSDVMKMLEGDGWSRVYVDGGKVVQSFLRDGLISDIVLTHVPVLIGEGLSLFGSLEADIDLNHVDTRTFPSGLVTSRYRVVGKAHEEALPQ
jgi:dihydrofolate reductase